MKAIRLTGHPVTRLAKSSTLGDEPGGRATWAHDRRPDFRDPGTEGIRGGEERPQITGQVAGTAVEAVHGVGQLDAQVGIAVPSWPDLHRHSMIDRDGAGR
jgi:hypothetical protein